MFEKIINNEANIFYPLDVTKIAKAEKKMKVKFPKELRDFYEQVGYGFISDGTHDCGINRLIDPLGCADIRLRESYYECDSDLEMYESYEKKSIIFFEFLEGTYGSIGIKDGKIYYASQLLADSLTEFLEKMSEDVQYWTKLGK